jgi:Uma2 family endonuclease
MARPAPQTADEEVVVVPATVRFPVELTPPDGFDPERLETWPRVEGRLEWVAGRLLYMPPCGDLQQLTTSDLVATLVDWARSRPEFAVGTNEAGMLLRGDVRGAEATIWRRAELGTLHGGLPRISPILAAEVAGRDEGEAALRDKARWYLGAGVSIVWRLFPRLQEVVVLTESGETRHRAGDVLPADPRLPDLAPAVDELFLQVARGT